MTYMRRHKFNRSKYTDSLQCPLSHYRNWSILPTAIGPSHIPQTASMHQLQIFLCKTWRGTNLWGNLTIIPIHGLCRRAALTFFKHTFSTVCSICSGNVITAMETVDKLCLPAQLFCLKRYSNNISIFFQYKYNLLLLCIQCNISGHFDSFCVQKLILIPGLYRFIRNEGLKKINNKKNSK